MKAILIVAVLLTVLGCASDGRKPAETSEIAASVDAEQPPPSENAFSDADERSICDQVERNWNLGSPDASPDLAGMVIEMRIALLPDGTVTKMEILNDQPGNATFRQAAESARRAVAISSPLKLPPGIEISSLILRFDPDQIMQ